MAHTDDAAWVSIHTLSGSELYNCNSFTDFGALKQRFDLSSEEEERYWFQSALLRYFYPDGNRSIPHQDATFQIIVQYCLFGKLDSFHPSSTAHDLVQYCLLEFFHLDGKLNQRTLQDFYGRNLEEDFYSPTLFHDRQIAEFWLRRISNTHPISSFKLVLWLLITSATIGVAISYIATIQATIFAIGGVILIAAYGLALLSTLVLLNVLAPIDQNKVQMVRDILERINLQGQAPIPAEAHLDAHNPEEDIIVVEAWPAPQQVM